MHFRRVNFSINSIAMLFLQTLSFGEIRIRVVVVDAITLPTPPSTYGSLLRLFCKTIGTIMKLYNTFY
jgi:hypothetical protein